MADGWVRALPELRPSRPLRQRGRVQALLHVPEAQWDRAPPPGPMYRVSWPYRDTQPDAAVSLVLPEEMESRES